jgi:tetratricopeptide (TPR) repeat protein
VVISAVSGMGGIGKSELALQYAFGHLTITYPGGICWLKAREDLGLQIIEFARIYANLEPPTDLELIAKVRWCWQRWRDAATLIIFDDVQGYEDIQPFLPPPQSQFRVLLTSRSKFSAPVQDCEIKVLSEARSIELLGSFSDDVKSRIAADLATAKEICHWLGYLPLGLELVGRYLTKKRDLSLAQGWERLQAQRLNAKALLKADPGMTASLGVIAAFELSWQELTPVAQELAARLSLFALSEIPWELVEACLYEWDEEELEDIRDEALVTTSLLTCTKQGMYELHQLLREFFALKLVSMPRRVEFTTEFAQVLTEIAKTIPETVTLEHQANLIEFIPHITAATEFSQYLPDDDKIWGCTGLARFYESQSQFSTAEPLYVRSLAISEQELGANHPATATSLNNLAGLYRSMGRYTEAEPLHVRSLAIREQELGANHPDTAASLNNLALLYESMGRYAAAEPLYVRSLAIYQEVYGENHPEIATNLSNLALLYRSMGKYTEAEPLHKRSLAIDQEVYGENHPKIATDLNNLANLYYSMGRYAEAELLYKRSLAILEKELVANHPNISFSLNNLALLYESMGRYAEAEPLHERSLAIREKELGANHPSTATSLNNLASLYRSMGRYAEAEPLYKRSLAIWEKELGANHPSTATSLNNLALLYESMGRYADAEPLYERSLTIREKELGANHPDTAASLNNLAYLYKLIGRYAEAEPLYVRALSILKNSLGTNHPSTKAIRTNLQILLQQLEPPSTNG